MKVQIATWNDVVDWIQDKKSEAGQIMLVWEDSDRSNYIAAFRKESVLNDDVQTLTVWEVERYHHSKEDKLSDARALEIYMQAAQRNISGKQNFCAMGHIISDCHGVAKLLCADDYHYREYMDAMEKAKPAVFWRDETGKRINTQTLEAAFSHDIMEALPHIIEKKEASVTETPDFDESFFNHQVEQYVLHGELMCRPDGLGSNMKRLGELTPTIWRLDIIADYLRGESEEPGKGIKAVVDLAVATPYLQEKILKIAQLRVAVKAWVEKCKRETPDIYGRWMRYKAICEAVKQEPTAENVRVTAGLKVKKNYHDPEANVTETFSYPANRITHATLHDPSLSEYWLPASIRKKYRYIRFRLDDIITITYKRKTLYQTEE